MAFTPEDGTGVVGANSFAAETVVTSYLTDRGREEENEWLSLSAGDKQEAAIRGTDAIEQRFGVRFKGGRVTTTQGLSWPRSDVVVDGITLASDALPKRLLDAWSEYAVRAAAGIDADALPTELLPDPESSRGAVVGESFAVAGSISESTQYAQPNRSGGLGVVDPSQVPVYTSADLLLAPLLNNAGIFGRVSRI